jgi:hypothetical protein
LAFAGFTELRLEKGLTDLLPDLCGERPKVLPAGADEDGRFDRAQQIIHDFIVI